MQAAATTILKRAVELDKEKRYTESLLLYQEGIDILLQLKKGHGGEKGAYFLKRIEEYMGRAESIKKLIDQLKQDGKYHEQIEITDGSTGHSYHKVFRRFMDADITSVAIEDPYIRAYHQIQNLIRFLEVVVKCCSNVRTVNLVTVASDQQQMDIFDKIKKDLKDNHKVLFNVDFSATLHDRKVVLNNGWIVKLGRGLDYFKAPAEKHALGTYDLDLRPCHQTTIDIFHTKGIVNSKSN